MTTTAAITNRWQLHIPKAMRTLAGLSKPSTVTLTVKRGAITLKPKKNGILALGGSLHKYYKKNPINVDRIRDYIDYSS